MYDLMFIVTKRLTSLPSSVQETKNLTGLNVIGSNLNIMPDALFAINTLQNAC